MHVQVVIQAEDGSERTETFPVGRAISIGRHPTCVLRLDSDLVSRQHAVVEPRDGSIIVEDVSTNGTIAGDMLLKRNIVEVPYGTPIVVGDFTVFFFPADAQEMQPTAVPHGHGVGNGQGHGQHGGMPGMPGMHGATQAPPTYAGGSQGPQAPGGDPTGALRHAQQNLNSYMNPNATGLASTGMNGHMNGHGMAMTGMTPGMGVTQNVPVQGMPQMGGPNGMTMPNGVPMANGTGVGALAVAQQMPLRHLDDARKKDVELRRSIHKALLEHLDLATIDAKKLDDPSMRPKVLNALRRIVAQMDAKIPKELDRDQLIGELSDEALGLGPLERFLSDPTVSEIMVVDPNTIYVEHMGQDSPERGALHR